MSMCCPRRDQLDQEKAEFLQENSDCSTLFNEIKIQAIDFIEHK